MPKVTQWPVTGIWGHFKPVFFLLLLCVSDLGHASESNKNQNKSLLVYLQFSMIHTSASVHLCKLLRMDIMYIFLLPDLSSFKQPGSHPRCCQDSGQSIPISELFPYMCC